MLLLGSLHQSWYHQAWRVTWATSAWLVTSASGVRSLFSVEPSFPADSAFSLGAFSVDSSFSVDSGVLEYQTLKSELR